MQITHEEAHTLIHLKTDNALKPGKLLLLTEHLQDCTQCSTYADEVKSTEDILRSTMQKHWNHPAPLIQPGIFKARKSFLQTAQPLLATRYTAMGVVMLFIGFTVWQFMFASAGTPNPMVFDASPIPTPSLYLTTTKDLNGCQQIQYQVRPEDTLESVTLQFSVSKETIMSTNNLQSASIEGLTELTIPICSPTATGTTHPPIFTTTPFTETITYTPG